MSQQKLCHNMVCICCHLQIIYKDRTYTDKSGYYSGRDLSTIAAKEIPSTSLPDGETINKIFDRIKADGYEQVLAVTISSGLSGTYNVVRLMGEQRNDFGYFVLDTKNIGIGAGLQAIRAAELLNEGGSHGQELKRTAAARSWVRNKVFFNVARHWSNCKRRPNWFGCFNSRKCLEIESNHSCNDEGIYYTVAKSRGRQKEFGQDR